MNAISLWTRFLKVNCKYSSQPVLIVIDPNSSFAEKLAKSLSDAINFLKGSVQVIDQRNEKLEKVLQELNAFSYVFSFTKLGVRKLKSYSKGKSVSMRDLAKLNHLIYISFNNLDSAESVFDYPALLQVLLDSNEYNKELLSKYRQLFLPDKVVKISGPNNSYIKCIVGADSLVSKPSFCNPSESGNLLGSEIFFWPKPGSLHGNLSCFLTLRSSKGSFLAKSRVEMVMKEGLLVELNSESNNFEVDVLRKDLLSGWPCTARVAEVGVGLNELINSSGITAMDEKIAGTAHIAFGSNDWFGGPLSCHLHYDQVFLIDSIEEVKYLND